MKSRPTVRKPANRSAAGRKSGPLAGQSAPAAQPAAHFFSKRILLACALLIVLTVAAYAPVRDFRFVMWDDPEYVLGNAHVAQGLSWQGLAWALTSADAANWHPATWLSHMLDVQLYGMNAGPQHVTSLILHILNALLLFGVLYRMTAAWGRSFFVAGLFALHPLHVESVAWIAERKDVLSTLFWMLAMGAYVSYARRPGVRRYLPVVLWFALGLMAKPMLVTLPFVLLLLDFWPLARVEPKARLVWEKLPLFALAAISSIVTLVVQQAGGAVKGLEKVPLGIRLANAPAAYLAYIGKTLWPVRLAAFYPIGATPPVLAACLGVLLLVGVTVMAIRAGRRRGYLATGWFWFVGTLIPVIGLVQVGSQSMADRYTYVPLIGLFVIVAWGASELAARWSFGGVALPVAAACVLLACTALARAQVQYWSDSTALWQRALATTSGNYVANNNLGGVLMKQGRTSEAIARFAEALRIKPDDAEAQNNMGMALIWQEKFDEAARSFGEALRNQPDYADARNNLGRALMWQGKLDEAAQQFVQALRIKPDFAAAQSNLGMVLMTQGKLDEATQRFGEALRIDPGYAEAHDKLGSVLAAEGKAAESIAQYAEAVRLDPGYAEAHNDLGVALARQGKLDDAVQQFGQALSANPGYAAARDNLKMALAEREGGGR